MKSNVTVEELNAAVLLLTGETVNDMAELHLSGGIVTAVQLLDGVTTAARIPIGAPAKQPTEEVVDAEVVEEEAQDLPG